MSCIRDPERTEVRYLRDFADLANARVLEVGCGDGRLTWRYAASTGRVVAMDPDPMRLAQALHDLPLALRRTIAFARSQAEALPFLSESFDLAIFAWSL
jgi:ubiquinone/menaquinone biosynthesis C-methylase UbiE